VLIAPIAGYLISRLAKTLKRVNGLPWKIVIIIDSTLQHRASLHPHLARLAAHKPETQTVWQPVGRLNFADSIPRNFLFAGAITFGPEQRDLEWTSSSRESERLTELFRDPTWQIEDNIVV
jgi:hypothetical protein